MSKHVLIIGAGVIGLFSAHCLLQRGFRVTIIERGSPTDQGCSFGNAGYVCPSHIIPLAAPGMVRTALGMMLNPASPFYVKPRFSPELFGWSWKFFRSATAAHVERAAPLLRDLNVASRKCYEDFAGLPGNDFELKRDGLLMLCKSRQAMDHEVKLAERANALGVEARVLDAKQTAELEPATQLDILGSVYFPGDCHVTPGKLMACLRARVEEAGATIHWNTQLERIYRGRQSIDFVSTSNDDIDEFFDEYVLCAGSWSPIWARGLGLSLPMQAGKGYSLTLPNPRKLPRIPSILTEARVAVTPMGQTLRFGGTMEIAGINANISQRRVQQIIRSVPAYFPEFTPDDFAGIAPWFGLRPCSPDGLPYIGRSRAFDNLTIATGHAMMGISLAGITGKLVGQILAGETPDIDLRMLSPDRFSRRRGLGIM